MKKDSMIKFTRPHDPVLESMTLTTHEELKTLARKNGEHHAMRNMPGPSETNLEPYTNDLKNGYHRLAAQVFKLLQPDSHFPEARMDIEHMKDKDKRLDDEIKYRQNENQRIQYELGNFNPKVLHARTRMAVLISVIIAIGEIVYNTKAFQIVGENLMFAFVISTAISVAVFAFSHLIPFLLKATRTKLMRRIIILASIGFVIVVFTALAIFRTQYLAAHGLNVSPVYFVVINLFFFVVALLLSYFLLPTWKELKENSDKVKKYKDIERRKKEIITMQKEQEANKLELLERNKARMQINYYSQYVINEVIGMYKESLGIFESSNLLFRTDRCIPACFSSKINDLDIERLKMTFTNSNKFVS